MSNPFANTLADATRGLPEGAWTEEQAAQAMLNLSVEPAAIYADEAFRIITTAALETTSKDELALIIAHTTSTFAKNVADVGDRIASFAGWTEPQRAELNRRRQSVYERRLAELVATIGPAGQA